MEFLSYIFMKGLMPFWLLAALFSPIIFIFGYPLGIWAWKSRLAPRLGLTIVILTSLLLLIFAGETAWFIIYPPPPTGLEIDRLRPFTVYCYSGGPVSLLTSILMLSAVGIMILRKIRNRSQQSVAGYTPQGVGSPEP